MIEIEILRMQEKQDQWKKLRDVFERKHEFKTDIQRLHNHQFSSTVDEEIGVALLVVQLGVDWRILLDLSFEAIILCF